jgi:hypothetical protein
VLHPTGPSVPPKTEASDSPSVSNHNLRPVDTTGTGTESGNDTTISNDFPERWKGKSSSKDKVGSSKGLRRKKSDKSRRSKSAYKLATATTMHYL